jgi:hypothetical protein
VGGGGRYDADADVALDHPADGIEAAQLHAEPERPSNAGGLAAKEALNGARPVEADEILVKHLRKADLGFFRQRMIARHHQDEAVAAERIGGQPPRIHRAGDNADVADTLGDQSDDLVAQALFEVDADVRMGGQERAQSLGQEFGQRVGVGQHPDVPAQPAGIGAKILPQPLGLAQHGAGVLQKRPAGLGRRDAMSRPDQQRCAQRLLHVADAGRGGGQRQMGALGTVGDGAGLHHVAKQAQIGEVEAHG